MALAGENGPVERVVSGAEQVLAIPSHPELVVACAVDAGAEQCPGSFGDEPAGDNSVPVVPAEWDVACRD